VSECLVGKEGAKGADGEQSNKIRYFEQSLWRLVEAAVVPSFLCLFLENGNGRTLAKSGKQSNIGVRRGQRRKEWIEKDGMEIGNGKRFDEKIEMRGIKLSRKI
jgi:hypothetical protein